MLVHGRNQNGIRRHRLVSAISRRKLSNKLKLCISVSVSWPLLILLCSLRKNWVFQNFSLKQYTSKLLNRHFEDTSSVVEATGQQRSQQRSRANTQIHSVYTSRAIASFTFPHGKNSRQKRFGSEWYPECGREQQPMPLECTCLRITYTNNAKPGPLIKSKFGCSNRINTRHRRKARKVDRMEEKYDWPTSLLRGIVLIVESNANYN